MLDSIEEQLNEEINDELAKTERNLKKVLEESPIETEFDNDDEIDTKADLHLEIGLLEVPEFASTPSPPINSVSHAKKRPLEDATNVKADDFTKKKLKVNEKPPPGILRRRK